MKRILSIVAVLALTVSVATAQDEYKHWFLQLQGGAAQTVGETTWSDLISPAGAVSLGYQFSPVFAARLNANGWQGKGAIAGPTTVYKYNFVEGGVDLMADLCNLLGKNRADRTLNPYALVGVAANYAFNNDEANDLKAQFPTGSDNYLWDGSKFSPAAKAGLGLGIRLCDALDLNIEANESFINDHFNSKKGDKSPVDFQTAALVGLTFHFGRGAAAPAPVVAPVEPAKPAPAPEPAPAPVVKEPEPEPAPAAPAFESLTENIYFLINKWDIRTSEQAKIDEIVKVMNENPGTSIKISGYADKATGTASRNKFLSEKRCTEVANALVAAGISRDRISTEYYGDTVNPMPTPEENRVAICLVK